MSVLVPHGIASWVVKFDADFRMYHVPVDGRYVVRSLRPSPSKSSHRRRGVTPLAIRTPHRKDCEVERRLSDTVTVTVWNPALAADSVPVITPVVAFRLSPCGKPVALYVSGSASGSVALN